MTKAVGRRFAQVDVFAEVGLSGNPLAVVVDAEGLSADEMQALAAWTNLSETTFLLPPTDSSADYMVRIFDPNREMVFAGHPTLGSCHVWLENGGIPRNNETIVQECGIGLIEIRQDSNRLAFAAPELVRSGEPSPDLRNTVIEILGLSPDDVVDVRWIDNGPGWIGVLVRSAETVLDIEPNFADHKNLEIGVVGFHPEGSDVAIEVRGFYRAEGAAAEDPVTGSLNAAIAQWLIGQGLIKGPYIAAQGTRLGRRGRVHIQVDDASDVWVGGAVQTVVSGHIAI